MRNRLTSPISRRDGCGSESRIRPSWKPIRQSRARIARVLRAALFGSATTGRINYFWFSNARGARAKGTDVVRGSSPSSSEGTTRREARARLRTALRWCPRDAEDGDVGDASPNQIFWQRHCSRHRPRGGDLITRRRGT
eukprot:29629-Pelagococcus_subviridis.AAC.6